MKNTLDLVVALPKTNLEMESPTNQVSNPVCGMA
jgi:hypothetical protein